MTDESLIPEDYSDYLLVLKRLQENNPRLSLEEVEERLKDFLDKHHGRD